MYEEVRRLKEANHELGVKELKLELSKRFEIIPSRPTLTRWLAGESSPTSSMNVFVPTPSPALSFFVAAWLGDGWGDKADGGKRLRLQVRSKDFAEEFAAAATEILRKADHPYRARQLEKEDGTWFLVKVTSLQLFDFVDRPFTELAPILEAQPIGFLRGFLTAEGNPSVSVQKMTPNKLAVTICVSNTDAEYIRFARTQFEKLGYHPTSITVGYRPGVPHPIRGVSYTTEKTEWQFRLAMIDEVQKFNSEIGFSDKVKQDKARTAAALIKNLGAQNAAVEWVKLFEKRGRKWFRKS
jgi:intein-encoded DNA endonuclease-like protein